MCLEDHLDPPGERTPHQAVAFEDEKIDPTPRGNRVPTRRVSMTSTNRGQGPQAREPGCENKGLSTPIGLSNVHFRPSKWGGARMRAKGIYTVQSGRPSMRTPVALALLVLLAGCSSPPAD